MIHLILNFILFIGQRLIISHGSQSLLQNLYFFVNIFKVTVSFDYNNYKKVLQNYFIKEIKKMK